MSRLYGLHALLLDVGSVLMDELPTYMRFRKHAQKNLDGVGADVLLAALRASIRARRPRVAQHALVELGGDPELAAQTWKAIGNRDRLYAEVPAALAALAPHYRLAIVGNQGLEVRARLEEARILHYFDAVILSAEVGLAKPDPRIFQMALDQLGIEPAETAMVGDRLDFDILPARRLGMAAIRVRRGPHIWQQPIGESERPDLTVRSLTELIRRLTASR